MNPKIAASILLMSVWYSYSLDMSIVFANDMLVLPIKLGTPNQSLNVLFNTGSVSFWVKEYNDNPQQISFDTGFMHDRSSTYSTNNNPSAVRLYDELFLGKDSNDNLIVGTISFNQYPFILVEQCNLPNEIDGFFGFGYNESSSFFLSSLQSKNAIEHQILSLDIANELIQIGSFPEDIQSDLSHFSYCKAIQIIENLPSKSWKCLLTGVYTEANNTNYIPEEVPIEFNSVLKSVLVSYKLLSNLFHYHISLKNKSKCELVRTKKWFTVECNQYLDIDSLSDIKLKFGLMTIIVPKEHLFIKQNNSYLFIFQTHANFDFWKIGLSVLKHLKIVFDVDKGIIGVYSNRLVINEYNINKDKVFVAYRGKKNNELRLVSMNCRLLSIVCLICVFGSALNMYFTYQLKYANKERNTVRPSL